MKRRLGVLLWAVAALCSCHSVNAPIQGVQKTVVGWLERVSIAGEHQLILNAKIDTGADYCSLHVEEIEPFKRKGQKWVRFRAMNRTGESILLERKVVRTVRIKRKGAKPQKRTVIEMGICLADIYRKVQVNLVDRSGFNFHMLLGRNFLRGYFRVDPGAQYTQEPRCPRESMR